MTPTLILIPTIDNGNAGSLSFFEGLHHIDFEIKRIFYTYNVESNAWRGGHAHKSSKQFLFCPFGSIKIIADDGENKMTYILNDPKLGLFCDAGTWLDLEWLTTGSVLCVAASEYYDENDYIRDYNEFNRWRS